MLPALGADIQVVAEGAVGLQYLPSPHDVVDPALSLTSRAAFGLGSDRWDTYLVIDSAVVNAVDSRSQADAGHYVIVGDARFTLGGAGVRVHADRGGELWLAGRLEAYGVWVDSPIPDAGWETEIKPEVYEHLDEGLPPHEVSAGGSLGVEIGVRFREGVYGIASVEGTVMGLRGFPLRGAHRIGLVARF